MCFSDLPGLIDDDLLHLLAVVAEPDEVAAALLTRVDGLIDRVSVNAPYETDPAAWRSVVDAVRAG